jgi:hypothetical protein
MSKIITYKGVYSLIYPCFTIILISKKLFKINILTYKQPRTKHFIVHVRVS